jgi:phage terminase Nu1 subunit (DNA packaging protein)
MEKSADKLLVSTQLLADILGVSRNYISQLVNDYGAPPPESYGQYDPKKFVPWYIKRKDRTHEEELAKQQEAMNKGKERLDLANAKIKEKLFDEMESRLIPREQVEIKFYEQALFFKKGLEALSTMLPPLITGATRQEVTDIVKQKTDEIQRQISNVSFDTNPAKYEFSSDVNKNS